MDADHRRSRLRRCRRSAREIRSLMIMAIADMPYRSTTKVAVTRLQLDRQNPRLIGEVQSGSDEAVIARLYRGAELDELLQSISANGYLDIEPFVVMDGSENGGLIVLEGNRRLAALRLLREPDLVERIASFERRTLRIPQVAESLRGTLEEVTVYPVASRDRARAFIGFKHINGPQKWEAYAKAKFAADWYKDEACNDVRLEDIAESIGDRHDTIKRMVFAIYVLEQAASEDLFVVQDRQTRKFNFSHLYTALSRSQYMDYLGLGRTWVRYDPKPDPVPRERLDGLKSVLTWIYGSKSRDAVPVIKSQNPDIKRLGEVLVNKEALHVLETTHNLEVAHESTEAVDKRFTASLIRARDAIRDASNSLRAYDGKDVSLLDIAEDVKETADSVYSTMERKYRRSKSPE